MSWHDLIAEDAVDGQVGSDPTADVPLDLGEDPETAGVAAPRESEKPERLSGEEEEEQSGRQERPEAEAGAQPDGPQRHRRPQRPVPLHGCAALCCPWQLRCPFPSTYAHTAGGRSPRRASLPLRPYLPSPAVVPLFSSSTPRQPKFSISSQIHHKHAGYKVPKLMKEQCGG